MDELFQENLEAAKNSDQQQGFYQPMIEDFLEIDLARINSADIKRYLMKVRNSERISRSLSNNFVTCVAKDFGSFRLLRMYGVYSEIYGVRDECNFHVSENILDATKWLMKKMDSSHDEAVKAANYFGKAA